MKANKTVTVILILFVVSIFGVSLIVSGCGGSGTSSKEAETGKAEVTPVDEMRVRTAEDDPEIEISDYKLDVTGLVSSPLSLTYNELKDLPAEERLVELPCVEGWSETAQWRGPRLQGLLDTAGVRENAKTVVFYSPGGYTTSLTLEDVQKTDPLLAYEVNGETLPHDQGFPVRLVVPDKLGYKWIKWVEKIELVEGDYEGYWEERGYPNDADVE